jgi:hypothetical protein
MRPDRKKLLDELGFQWKDDGTHNFTPDDKLWHQQCEKLLECKQKNGHCEVSQTKNTDNKSLGWWVSTQRARRANDKMPPERKELLDTIDFVWKVDSLPTSSSATDARGLAV